MRFRATVELNGKTATGIEVPEEVVAELGQGQRPPVRVTIGGYSYRTTVARMGGRFLVSLSAENRAAAGVAAGDQVEVDLELDAAPREVEVPADLAEALARDDAARANFEGMPYSHRKEWVRWVTEAKKPDTRAARLATTVQSLHDGKRTRLPAAGHRSGMLTWTRVIPVGASQVPTMFAAISVWSSGSHSKTGSALARASSAVIAAGLGATVCCCPSAVTIMISNRPSVPSGPAVQFAFSTVTWLVCSLAPGITSSSRS